MDCVSVPAESGSDGDDRDLGSHGLRDGGVLL